MIRSTCSDAGTYTSVYRATAGRTAGACTVQGLAAVSGDDRFAWDSYRRFIQMYSDVVLGLDHHRFEDALEIIKEDNGFFADVEMSAEHWQALVGQYKAIVAEELGRPFPQDVH